MIWLFCSVPIFRRDSWFGLHPDQLSRNRTVDHSIKFIQSLSSFFSFQLVLLHLQGPDLWEVVIKYFFQWLFKFTLWLKTYSILPSSSTVNLKECLEAHNLARALHGARPLTWNRTLGRSAQAWALDLAKRNKFEHSRVRGEGENLYYSMGSSEKTATCKDALDAW